MDEDQIFLPVWPRWLGYVACCVGMFMAILDIQVVVTSLAVIEKALNIGTDQMSWIQTSYLIAESIAIPMTGLLMRVFGMKRLFSMSLLMFVLASIGCASSFGFYDLLVWRVVQGFSGGVIIPIVFSGIFLLFPKGIQQSIATTTGGFLAVLAPAVGPMTGGWITENYTWHWLFLINVVPGILAVTVGYFNLPGAPLRLSLLKTLDWFSLVLMSVALASLLIALKEAPTQGWTAPWVLFWFVLAFGSAFWMWKRPDPAIMFHLLEDRALAYGCALSFVLGICLFSSVFLMPVFLAFVRGHGPLETGVITLVTGIAQLIAAPIIIQIDRRSDARMLSAVGFTLFGIGLYMSTSQTIQTDYDGMFWPQIVRGVAIAMCILPPIRFALALMPLDKIGDASGIFNVARNIGGAIGIALVDTVMRSRADIYVDRVKVMITTAPDAAAKALGMSVADLPSANDFAGMLGIQDDLLSYGLTMAINDSWLLLTVACFTALPILWWMGPLQSALPLAKLAQSLKDGQRAAL
ncbi:MAG: DHA2 family efflux MFS transporter permease subunit [Alphaproteobacteria bacterium]|nr:DHA2 family efflux MFS transporter permease subunit [Alphaproteobacteria bacterium]